MSEQLALYISEQAHNAPHPLVAEAPDKEGSIDGYGGRAAMYKAALNQQWLNELTPLLYHTSTGLVFIGREIQNSDARGPYDRQWKLAGGSGAHFDSSLGCRVTRAAWVKQGEKVIGKRLKKLIDQLETLDKRVDVLTAQRQEVHAQFGEDVAATIEQRREAADEAAARVHYLNGGASESIDNAADDIAGACEAGREELVRADAEDPAIPGNATQAPPDATDGATDAKAPAPMASG